MPGGGDEYVLEVRFDRLDFGIEAGVAQAAGDRGGVESRIAPIWATLSTPGAPCSAACARRVCAVRTPKVRPASASVSAAGVPSATSRPTSRMAMRWQRSASSM